MNIFNTPSPEELVAAIERQLAHIANSGSGDVIRLRKEVQRTPDDPEQWFELGIALNQAGLQYRDLALQLADFHYRLTLFKSTMPPLWTSSAKPSMPSTT